ncbi:hypothetical protein EJB05_07278, partial [Eragrostis curvula]
MASSAAATTLGGRGGALTPASVYALSVGLASPSIDPSALQRLSIRAPSPQETSVSLQAIAALHAAAVVLLNKLLLTAADSPSDLITASTATRLAEALKLAAEPKLAAASEPKLAVAPEAEPELAAALRPASRDEAAVATASAPVAVALAALIDCSARGDASAFEVPVSGDGLSAKDEADVATDVKMLIFGSKLVCSAGGASSTSFPKVPSVNGIFREAVRALHARVRIELNSPVRLGKRVFDEFLTRHDY